MPSNSAASMFGGAGGRGSRASVASLQGLRNVLRHDADRDRDRDRDRDSAPAALRSPVEPRVDAAPAAAPAAPADDKQTLRGLNDRLSGYLGRVRDLEKENQDLEDEIDEILSKRKTPEVRDWNEVEKPLEGLKKQIKDIAMDNAKLLLQIENTKLANEDFTKKLDDEIKAGNELEKDLQDLKKTREDTKLNQTQAQREMDLVKEELGRLERDHREEVDVLVEKVKDSEVKVEMESKSSDLAEVVNNIRYQYDKLAKKNLKDTEEWYQRKFENIKVAEAQNNEHLQSGKSELKELLTQKRSLEIKLQAFLSKLCNLEEALNSTKVEYGQRLGPLNRAVLHLQAELRKVRAQVERHVENNNNLLCVKMKLETEMDNYQRLLQGITADPESLDLSLEDVVRRGRQKPDDEGPVQLRRVEEEAPVKREHAPKEEEGGDLVKDEVAVDNAAAPAAPSKKRKPKTKTKNDSSSSSSSSSSSENEDQKPKKEEEVKT